MRFSVLLLCTTAANELLDTSASAQEQPNLIADDVTPSGEYSTNETDQPTASEQTDGAREKVYEDKSESPSKLSPAETISTSDAAASGPESPANSTHSPASSNWKKEAYSYEDNDYPGADEGVLVELPSRASGPISPFELDLFTEAEDADAGSVNVSFTPHTWPDTSELVPYYEWMIAQARGNRFALPEPLVQQLEQLNYAIQSFDTSMLREVPVERRRRLQLDSLLSLLNANGGTGYSLLSAGPDSGLAFNAQQFPGLVNTISGSVSNVVQAAGEAVGVTTTTAKPVSQAVLGMLSILQGFQKLAEAAGSMGLQFKPTPEQPIFSN